MQLFSGNGAHEFTSVLKQGLLPLVVSILLLFVYNNLQLKIRVVIEIIQFNL